MRVAAAFVIAGLCAAAHAQPPGQTVRQPVQAISQPGQGTSAANPAQQAAPVPNTPANMPPQPPNVTYQNGLLTIRAENSTLADVLTEVRNKTGAQIQVPPGASMERIAIQEGPAPPRAALTALLHGSGFDYIIVGSMQDPQSVQRVMLTPHVESPASPPQPAYAARRSQPAPEYQSDEEQNNEQPMPAPPPAPNMNQPGMRGQQQPSAQQPAQESGANSGGIKTPEQLLQELQQIQRGQQGQQTPGQPTQPQTPPQMPPRRVPMNPPNVP